MNSLEDIWQSILQAMEEEGIITPTAMNTWFSDCRPVELGDRLLIFQTSSDFKRKIILSRFAETIKSKLSELFSTDIDIRLLLKDEVDTYLANSQSQDDSLPEALGYTFDRFIVGQSNKYAHAAALAVSRNPGRVYNPLFIYGNSGLGKTHLMLAIGQAIRENDPNIKIGYVKGDEFTNQLIKSIQTSTQEEFRQRYRYLDLFLVDDIQFISGKQAFQLEFFHTFETLYHAGKQIVITSDRPPMDIATLEDRLRSRFEGGLMADIQPPDLETRIAITRNKAQIFGLVLSDSVVEYISEKITANIRQIEGVIHKLTAFNQMDGPITTATVDRAIADVIRTGVYIPTPEVIIAETGRFFDVDPAEIRGQRRSKNTALARHTAMYLIRNLTNLSLVDIGEEFDHRNHSAVITSIRKVEVLLNTDPKMSDIIRDITSNINSLHDR